MRRASSFRNNANNPSRGCTGGGQSRRHIGTNLRSEKVDSEYDGDDADYSVIRYFSILRDKRRFSWALLSILKNNMVSAPFFYLLLIGDYLILIGMFMVFCFTQFQYL
jgi:hypothetical protein